MNVDELFDDGLKKAKGGDIEGAILDWTAVIERDPKTCRCLLQSRASSIQ